MPIGIDHNHILCLEWRNGFDLDMIIAKSSVSTLGIGLVQLDTVRDSTEQLTDIALDREVEAGLEVIAFREGQEILKIWDHRPDRVRVFSAPLLVAKLLVDFRPGNPFAVIIKCTI